MKQTYSEKIKYARERLLKIPYLKFLGVKVDKLSPGRAVMSLSFRKQYQQAYGLLHGGVIASLVDTAAAFAGWTLAKPEQKFVTLEFKINFTYPVTTPKFFAYAKIIHYGKKTFITDVEVKNSKNVLCAKALVTYMFI